MQLTIGSKNIEIANAQPLRDLHFGVYLAIKIPKDKITAVEIESVFNNNAETIIITNDDGSTVEYSGYNELGKYTYDNGYYNICQICVSETQHQINVLMNRLTEQDKTNATVAAALMDQSNTNIAIKETLENHAANITQQAIAMENQNKVINTQAEQVSALNEAAAMQMASMDSLLLDVLPVIITDAVTIAVAEALANNAAKEEVVEETLTEETETTNEETTVE